MSLRETFLGVGCAGWSIPKQHAHHFSTHGTHLERYASRFAVVEINSSFYRPHRPATYARWAASVAEHFRFAVKIPKEITHTRRLVDATEALERFLAEVGALGTKLGPLLIQLPPSLRYDERAAGAFFATLRERFGGFAACEPRHPSWFGSEADHLLQAAQIARVAADPAPTPSASVPGGSLRLVYYRLHGSPDKYTSSYSNAYLDVLFEQLVASAQTAPTWCIFDNTALGAATADALSVVERQTARITG